MDTITREVKAERKRQNAIAVERQRKRNKKEEERQAELHKLKCTAAIAVHDAAEAAIGRIDKETWVTLGKLVKVCSITGPHSSFFCLLHRSEIALLEIPGAGAYNSYSYEHSLLLLGADGNIYRYGRNKVYRAALMERDNPADIKSLIPKLNKMK